MTEDGRIEIETPRGGRVIVTFADAQARAGAAAIEAATAFTRAGGPQGEIEGVVVAEALRLGLEATVMGWRHPMTRIVVSRHSG
jgi:hypothetical protein